MAAEQTMQARLAIHGERVVYPMLMHVEGIRIQRTYLVTHLIMLVSCAFSDMSTITPYQTLNRLTQL